MSQYSPLSGINSYHTQNRIVRSSEGGGDKEQKRELFKKAMGGKKGSKAKPEEREDGFSERRMAFPSRGEPPRSTEEHEIDFFA